MPDIEWMTNVEAAAILGVSTAHVSTLAKRREWRSQNIPQEERRPMTFYAERDVMAAMKSDSQKRTLIFIAMRDWADSLPEAYIPTEEEMTLHVERPFTIADMRSMIETRKYRRGANVRRPDKVEGTS
jgi:hypothetical protein